MIWLKEFLTFIFKASVKAVLDHIRFLGNKITAFIATILALIMTPVNWFLDWATSIILYITEMFQSLAAYLANLNLDTFQNYWLAFAPYFGLLDLFVPLGLMTGTIATLLVIWVVCFVIRLIIRLIPTAG